MRQAPDWYPTHNSVINRPLSDRHKEKNYDADVKKVLPTLDIGVISAPGVWPSRAVHDGVFQGTDLCVARPGPPLRAQHPEHLKEFLWRHEGKKLLHGRWVPASLQTHHRADVAITGRLPKGPPCLPGQRRRRAEQAQPARPGRWWDVRIAYLDRRHRVSMEPTRSRASCHSGPFPGVGVDFVPSERMIMLHTCTPLLASPRGH